MEKTKVKQVIREALAREPAIEWYQKNLWSLRDSISTCYASS